MFHVPETARLTDHPYLASSKSYGNNGAFIVDSCEPGWKLALICSDGSNWEHVSVHAFKRSKQRTPSWKEMCFVKDICWDDEDTVIQYHPPKSEYVNNHPNCLHLWRPTNQQIPLPDSILVGIK